MSFWFRVPHGSVHHLIIPPDTFLNTKIIENRTERPQYTFADDLSAPYSSAGPLSEKASHSFSFLSGIRKNLRLPLAGSLTIEAAMVLPLLFFCIYLLLFPLRAMDSERQLRSLMDRTARTLTEAEYVRVTGSRYLNTETEKKETIDGLVNGLESGTAMAVVLAGADRKMLKNLYFHPDTAILSDAEGKDSKMVYMKLCYDLNFPFSAFSGLSLPKTMVVSRRAWVGSEGGRGRETYADPAEMYPPDEEAAAEDPIVYVGQNSTRYHEDPNCHYLSNVMQSTDASAIGSLRNSSGGRYHACPGCKPGTSGTVYYFANGSAYHSSESCKAITAYRQEVHKSEVEHLGPCSYCSRH